MCKTTKIKAGQEKTVISVRIPRSIHNVSYESGTPFSRGPDAHWKLNRLHPTKFTSVKSVSTANFFTDGKAFCDGKCQVDQHKDATNITIK